MTGNIPDKGSSWTVPAAPFTLSTNKLPGNSPALLFSEDAKLLLLSGRIPLIDELIELFGEMAFNDIWIKAGEYNNSTFVLYSGDLGELIVPIDLSKPETGNFRIERIRALLPGSYPELGEAVTTLVFRAYQLFQWNRSEIFCSRSGQILQWSERELAKCGSLGTVFPRISPAVIVAVERNGKILLARSQRSAKAYFSLIAGFVEAGESLEDAVHREVREEVGLEVCELQYTGSQSWPFPDALMLGFRAKWKSGEILIQEDEIAEAAWFSPDSLPELPGGLSIAKTMIETMCSELRGEL
ncbi:NAD(+) diphosphatase [Spirochaeta dissipatitropha]